MATTTNTAVPTGVLCDQPGCGMPATGVTDDRIYYCAAHEKWSHTNRRDADAFRETSAYKSRGAAPAETALNPKTNKPGS